MKMLVRCKMMIEIRSDLIQIFNLIEQREKTLKELNYVVIHGDKGGRFDIN